MKEKVVLITGSSRGIGREAILEFAKNGYNVVINYLNSEDEASELKKLAIKMYNVKALCIKCDVKEEKSVIKMIDTIISEFGKIDVLVNNAGISKDALIEDKTLESFKEVIDTNLIGTFLVTKHAAKEMKKSNEGVIINVSSTNGIDTGYPSSIDYDASKAGVISLTSNFAKELAPSIRVNAVAPGWVNTDMLEEMDKSLKKEEEGKVLLKRFADAKEIAKVIYFLASNDASYINNSVIRVDGGVR